MKNLIAYFIIAGLSIFVVQSCLTERKAVHQAARAADNYPDTVKALFRSKWPFVPTITKKDSTDYKKYLVDIARIQHYYDSIDALPLLVDTLIDVWEDEQKIAWYKNQLSIKEATIKRKDARINELIKKCNEAPAVHDTIFVKDTTEIRTTITIKEITGKIKRYWPWLFAILPVILLLRRKKKVVTVRV